MGKEDPRAESDVFTAVTAEREVSLTGYTRARHEMDIVSEEAGRCIRVTADVGDTIGEDGIFAFLDTTFIDISIKKNEVEQKRLENRMVYWSKEVSRYVDLVSSNAAAQNKLDELRNNLDQVRFQLEALKVENTNLKERRQRFSIKVPRGWKIIERRVEPGEWVAVGENLGEAGDFQTLLVPFSLAPEEYQWLRGHNDPVVLSLPDQSKEGMEVDARVERISPDFDPQTRKIKVDLSVGKGLPEKRGGIRCELALQLPDPSGAVLIHRSAIERRYEEFWLTRPNGERVSVVLLGEGPDNTLRIRSPKVKPGDRFIRSFPSSSLKTH